MPWSQTVMAAITGTLAWLSFLVSSVGCQNLFCPSTCSCLGALVDCSKRGLIDIPKDLPVWVEILDLQKNDLTTIYNKAFVNLSSLRELDLSHNQVRNLNRIGFRHLSELRHLKIEHNHLSDVPDLGLLPNLETLHLSNNEIFTINGTTLENYPNLKRLDVSSNKIVDVASGTFPNGTKLVYLGLNNNRIVSLEKGCMDNLTSLTELRLDKNRLTDIAKNQFRNLSSLKQLDLNRNRLQHIEGLAFQGLRSLEVLRLKSNNITTLPDGAFYGLSSIQTLHMEHNNISKIEKGWIYGLSSLQHLFLSHNSISEIVGGWEFCKRLQELDLKHNSLQSIKKHMFKNLMLLKKLYLSNNLISYIEEESFSSLSSLHILELNNNEISVTIEDTSRAFCGMDRLKYLNLAQNNVRSVGKRAFIGLTRLQILDLTFNPITSVQENAFSVLEKLRELKFNSSNLLCDCSLDWFPAWLILHRFQHSVIAKCNHPEWLKGKTVFEVNPSNFTCDDSPKPHITQHPKTQIALKDENLTLVCNATSSSTSAVFFQWRKNNTLLLDAETENFAKQDLNNSVTNYVSLLHIRATDNKDEGHYQCVISNQFGSVYSQQAHITVHEFPYFSKTPVDITVNVSSTAKLECEAQGSPAPVVSWQKDGDDFPAARERRMHVMPSDHAFFIVDVKTSDMGVYSCTAQNDVGTIIVNATLTVSETPSFVKPMQNKEIRAGETAVLECLASGSPKPKLTWTKDGGPLVATERHFFTVDNQLLIIVQTQISDSGDYTCEMSNSLGTEKDSSFLKIYPPHSDRSSGSQDDSTATGIIVIAVVCCVVGTSLVWVIIIYQTRKRAEEYVPTDTDDAALPGELAPFATYTAECTEEYKGSVPHLFLDSNSEHSSKDSGTGDSAKRSSDELLPSQGVKHHSLIILNDRSHLTRLVRGSSLGSMLGAQSDISDDIGHSCPSTYTTTASAQSPSGTPQQHTPLLHNIHNGKSTKRKSFHRGIEETTSTDGETNEYPVTLSNEPSQWSAGSPCRSFSAEQLSNKKTGKLMYPRVAYIQAPNSSDERLNILCGSESLERDSGVSTFAHSSSPASTRSWSMGSLHAQRPPNACHDDEDSLSGRSGDFRFADHSTDTSSTLSLSKPSENSVVPKTFTKKPTPVQRVTALASNIPASHTGVV